jgi:hypothetical protein
VHSQNKLSIIPHSPAVTEREREKERESESALFGKLLQIFSYYAWLLARSHHIPQRTTFLAVWNLTRDCALAFWSLPVQKCRALEIWFCDKSGAAIRLAIGEDFFS